MEFEMFCVFLQLILHSNNADVEPKFITHDSNIERSPVVNQSPPGYMEDQNRQGG
jgi:hypothetical protein